MHQLLFEFCKVIRVTPNLPAIHQPVLSLAAVAPVARGAVEALLPTLLVRPLLCHGETDLHALAQVLAGADREDGQVAECAMVNSDNGALRSRRLPIMNQRSSAAKDSLSDSLVSAGSGSAEVL